ncbi:MAG: metal ABC transporter solute-binding protein, Zn/Mn family [Paracoccaceae bacterium]|jgi:zinc/manganese transport system substrate-binding protein|nr:metal ABC transporter substrate-binding protein [Paracoccaceae bacterium]
MQNFTKLVAIVAFTLYASASLAKDRIKIVASFSILGNMVEQVVGGHADVTTIVGPDADAHVYQPSAADARAVADADIIFVNGLGFETWSDTLIVESGTNASVHVATAGVKIVTVDGSTDPHAWNSLSNGVVYVNNIAATLSEKMPTKANMIEANRAAYVDQLLALDIATKATLANLPANKRTVVTAHDAFGYLADAYDMIFLAPVGIDTDAEPSAQELAVLIDQLKADGAAALFVENITSPALVQQIADETGLTIGGRLFSDALSERGGPATSYLAMFEHNLETLLTALEGNHS